MTHTPHTPLTIPAVPAASAQQAAVLGQPIAHSLSPVIHQTAYELLGLDWSYGRIEKSDKDLAAFIDQCLRENASGTVPPWRGLSLTMPLKERVLELAQHIEPMAAQLRSANTLIFSHEPHAQGTVALYCYNTDVPGMARAVTRGWQDAGRTTAPRRALLLGAGATARSTLASLDQIGVRQVDIAARRLEAAEAVRDTLTQTQISVSALTLAEPTQAQQNLLESIAAADIIVSTLPGGAVDRYVPTLQAGLTLRTSAWPLLHDVAYQPFPNLLSRLWAEQNAPYVPGLELLLEQGLVQITLMTGQTLNTPQQKVVRAALYRAAGQPLYS